MQKTLIWLAISLSITAVLGADKETRFATKPADQYPSHVTQEKVTIAAKAFVEPEEIKLAFGKMDPLRYGLLPVLLVIQNDTGQTLRLDLQAEYVDPTGHHIEPTAPEEVQYVGAPPRRKDHKIGIQNPLPFPTKKNAGGPLGGWEIVGRAFNSKMVLPGESASGFFYFQTKPEKGAKFYVLGISNARTGKELFYFEVPLN